MKLLNNNVLISLENRQDWLNDSEGKQFLQSINIVERWQHSCCWGKVIAVPEKLTKDYAYGTTVEIKAGDIIIFYYLAIEMTRDGDKIAHSKMIGDNYIINYDKVFACVRDGEVIPVNGWVIAEQIEEIEDTKLIVNRKKSKLICKILYKGTPNAHYKDELYKDVIEDDSLSTGDRVVLPAWRVLPFEKEEHSIVKGNLVRFQRKDIDWNYDDLLDIGKRYKSKNKESDSQKKTAKAVQKFIVGSTKETKGVPFNIVHKPRTKHIPSKKNHYLS
jgi:co-chaperonin GroES (HSP10)